MTDTGAFTNVIDNFNYLVSVDRHRVIEEHIKLVLRPKPRWLPTFIYNRIISRLIVVETQTKI